VVGAGDEAVSTPSGHVRTEVPAPEGKGPARTVISAGRDVELGARSMLVLAEGLFRLDVVPNDDTIQTIVRSLSSERRRAELRDRAVAGETVSFGGPGAIEPRSTGRFGGEIVLIGEDGLDQAVARVLVGSVCHPDRGITTFTAQATLL
jgi:hypothetical protein